MDSTQKDTQEPRPMGEAVAEAGIGLMRFRQRMDKQIPEDFSWNLLLSPTELRLAVYWLGDSRSTWTLEIEVAALLFAFERVAGLNWEALRSEARQALAA